MQSRQIPWSTLWCLSGAIALLFSGCSRTKYRVQADRDAYSAIAERNHDPAWQTADYSIEMDSRSRYFDPYHADCPPMPQDDPTAQQYMRCVDGKKGWRHWLDNGIRDELENPRWKDVLEEYVEFNESGEIRLGIDSALTLAYMHSPNHQRQLETLYLSSLDVNEERFRLDTQFFGGYDTVYEHNGTLIPAGLSFDSGQGKWVVTAPFDNAGSETNRLTVGRPSSGSPALQTRRFLATSGEIIAGFANSFVVEFTGTNASLSGSLANFAFVQPLLRGAGRDIALEQLTRAERTLLGNLRAYAQFRQGFYTQVAIGELGVRGPSRFGSGTSLQSFSGSGFVGGYLGLLQQVQRIRNIQDNLDLQLRTLEQLEVRLDFGSIDLVQVDQFRQSVERARANLLRSQNSYELAIENFKTDTLGLPPELPVDLDATLLNQFQLVSRDASLLLDRIVELQTRIGTLEVNEETGDLSPEVDVQAVAQLVDEVIAMVSPVQQQLSAVPADIRMMEELAPLREQTLTDKEIEVVRGEREQLHTKLADLEIEFAPIPSQLEMIRAQLSPATRDETVGSLSDQLRKLRRVVERSVLVQAGARLESVMVENIDLDWSDALQIALSKRLDFMNGRAALVDTWRLIQVNADALQGVLNITADADIRTSRNNSVSFRAPTGSARLGVEFDAPFTRLLERNDYREALINYQRDRRQFIQSRDSLSKGIRALLRQVELLRRDLEIQRRAVTIALRQVDVTQAALDAPARPAQPGQRPVQFGPTATINLLNAASALRDTQNSFLAVWLDYFATRLRLEREMGRMELDNAGVWVTPESNSGTTKLGEPNADEETSNGPSNANEFQPDEIPPPIPQAWLDMMDDTITELDAASPIPNSGEMIRLDRIPDPA